MRRLRWIRTLVVVTSLCLLCACETGNGGNPSISVTPPEAEQGAMIRVTGKSWQPGERVDIALSRPGIAHKDAEPITDVLADASGSFVALFAFPGGDRWGAMEEVQVVARVPDLSRIAVSSLRYVPQAAVTAAPTPARTSTWPAESVAYVLGYVEEISTSARIIALRAIEGQSDVIVLVEGTRIIWEGQVVQLQDILEGDLVEGSGRLGMDESLIADEVRILARSEANVTATTEPTPTQSALTWRGEYYGNTTFSGSPSVVREDPVIDFQWQEALPVEGLPADNFAVRWAGLWPFEAGVYRFNALMDDGARLWLDGHLLIDHWHESSGALYSADAYVGEGSHDVRVEYFDAHGSAYAKLWWEYRGPDAGMTFTDWKSEYYASGTLDGTPYLVLNDRTLDFNWGLGVPASGMPEDDFTVRWTRTVNVQAGAYRFHAHVDDGVRVWVDNAMVIDEWKDGPARTIAGDIALSDDEHLVRVEYYERTGHALIRVWWGPAPVTPTPTPTEMPQPTGTPSPVPPTEEPTATSLPPEPTLEPTLTPNGTETPG